MSQSIEKEKYDIFSVDKVTDDVFGTGESIVSSFAYATDGNVKEVYLENVDEDVEKLRYSLREFGHMELEQSSGKINYEDATDPQRIVEAVLEDNSDEWNNSDLDGIEVA